MQPAQDPSVAPSLRRFVALLPNLLSLLRLVLAGIFPVLPIGWRLPVVIAGGVSDWLDGFVARRFDARSRSGSLLDAIADKLFVVSVLVTLCAAGQLGWWQGVAVMARDLMVAFVTSYVAMRRDWAAFHRLIPRLPGKLTTMLQFALFITVLAWESPTATTVVFTATALCSGLAGGDYVVQFGKALRQERRDG